MENVCRLIKCGKPSKYKLCEEHRILFRERQKALIDYRIKHNLCIRCTNKPALPGKRYCQRHFNAISACSKKQVQERKKSGTCRFCFDPAVPNKLFCEKHQNHLKNKKRARYQAHAKEGLCRRCKNPTFSKYKYCQVHFEYNRKKVREYQARLMQRVEKGICIKCDLPVLPERVTCETHYNIKFKKEKEFRQKYLKKKRDEQVLYVNIWGVKVLKEHSTNESI